MVKVIRIIKSLIYKNFVYNYAFIFYNIQQTINDIYKAFDE